jgi:hypothetical protein
MTKQAAAPNGDDNPTEPTIAELIGSDARIPPLYGKMFKTWIELPDHSWLKVRISRQLSPK